MFENKVILPCINDMSCTDEQNILGKEKIKGKPTIEAMKNIMRKKNQATYGNFHNYPDSSTILQFIF